MFPSIIDHFEVPFVIVFLLAIEFVLHRRRSRELKNAQRFLRLAKQETLETAQISLGNPYPLIQVSDKGDVTFINPAAFDKFPEIREKGLKHPILSGLDKIINKNESVSREVEFSKLVYNQTISPTRVNGHTAFTIYCYDVTERKANEKELQKSREAAEKANQARGDFLANMSHELRTPMNGIIGLSDILVEAGLEPKHHELIEAVNSSAHNLLILLNDILDFSKIEAGELTLEAIPFDLRRIVKQIESLQKPVAIRKGLEMKSVIDNSVPPLLIGDPSRLQQILNNLIGNALKFTTQGSITLSVGGQMDKTGYFTIRISVTDTGIGIPKAKQDKLFKKFQQADASTSRQYGGTGLGLAISKNLAKLMDGNISLQSMEGKGSTFSVTIPARIAETVAVENDDRNAGKLQTHINKNAKIMIVDDHPVNLLFMRRVLSKLGVRDFEEASSGKQAIELFRKNTYDLILMDCQMPEMDGYETSKQIRQLESNGHKSVIIAVTANAMKGAEEKCTASGMDDYISKPVDKEKLEFILQHWIPGGEDIETKDRTGEDKKNNPVPQQPIKTEDKLQESSSVFDWDHLYEYTDGDKETEKMLINMFLENLDIDLKNLEKNFHDRNFKGWEAVAHKLHGASAHMGACALADICDRAQSLPLEDAERMKDLHQTILSESQRLHGVLVKMREAA